MKQLEYAAGLLLVIPPPIRPVWYEYYLTISILKNGGVDIMMWYGRNWITIPHKMRDCCSQI